jgi:hypothetical protein
MMGPRSRYTPKLENGKIVMWGGEKGEWVEATAYDELKAENEKLRADLARLRSENVLVEIIKSSTKNIEALTKLLAST